MKVTDYLPDYELQKDRKAYQKKYYDENKDRLKKQRAEMALEKKLLGQFDRYLVEYKLWDYGSYQRELFFAKDIARKVQCDPKLFLAAKESLTYTFPGVLESMTNALEFIASSDAVLARFYKYCALRDDFKQHKDKLIQLSDDIIYSHASTVKLAETINNKQ